MKIISFLITGIARLVNPSAYYRQRFQKTPSPFCRDFNSLKSDWSTIGRDFRKVLVNYGK